MDSERFSEIKKDSCDSLSYEKEKSGFTSEESSSWFE